MPTPTDPQYETIRQAYRDLGDFALGMASVATRLPIEPNPRDFRAIVKDLEALTHRVDFLIATIGEYVEENTPRKVEMQLFQNQLAGALEGQAFYEIEACAERIIEDRDELAEGDADAKWMERV